MLTHLACYCAAPLPLCRSEFPWLASLGAPPPEHTVLRTGVQCLHVGKIHRPGGLSGGGLSANLVDRGLARPESHLPFFTVQY